MADFFGTSGFDDIEGTSGDDTITGRAGSDRLSGGSGNDIIRGGAGSDFIEDGAGDDLLVGNLGDDIFVIRGGNDRINGGEGDDRVFFSIAEDSRARVDVGVGNDAVTVSEFNSSLELLMFGREGNDTVNIRYAQRDSVFVLDMGVGDDIVRIGVENSNDFAAFGDYTLTLGDGQDRVELAGPDGASSIVITDFETGAGGDQLVLTNPGNYFDFDQASNPFATGNFLLVQDGDDTVLRVDVDGASGSQGATDLVRFSNTIASEFTTDNLGGLPPDGSDIPGVTITGSGEITGTLGADMLTGSNMRDEIAGLAGADVIDGGRGGDSLRGGAGNDSIRGGLGDDFLEDGTGDDLLVGNLGNDTFAIVGGDDRLLGGDGDDFFSFNLGEDSRTRIDAGAGQDEMSLSESSDSLELLFFGRDGDDTVDIRYSADGSVFDLDMGAGHDIVRLGIEGFETLIANGDFVISLGAGQDRVELSGPYGATSLVISDFEAGPNGDALFLVDPGQYFDYDQSSNPFADGNLTLVQDGADTVLRVDVDGAAGPDVATDLVRFSGTNVSDFTADNLGGLAPDGSDLSGITLEASGEFSGSLGGDMLTGSAIRDVISGFAGSDVINGGDGSDDLFGGAGNDTLRGGLGQDYLVDGLGDDLLVGNMGDDYLIVQGGDDRLLGGDGDDTIDFRLLEDSTARADGGQGNDELRVSEFRHTLDLTFFGGDGDDMAELRYTETGSTFDLDMGAGNDLITLGNNAFVSVAALGDFTLTLGDGQDTVELLTAGVTFNRVTLPLSEFSLTITDFEAGESGDVFSMGFDRFITNWDGTEDPFAIGAARLVQDGADTLVQFEQFIVEFQGRSSMAQAWTTVATLSDVDANTLVAANFAGFTPVVVSTATSAALPGDMSGLTGMLDADVLGAILSMDDLSKPALQLEAEIAAPRATEAETLDWLDAFADVMGLDGTTLDAVLF